MWRNLVRRCNRGPFGKLRAGSKGAPLEDLGEIGLLQQPVQALAMEGRDQSWWK